jgi:hypothetical protein
LLNHHEDAQVTPGDDWEIIGTLLDVDNNPLDLTDAQILWTLLDGKGNLALGQDQQATVTITQPVTSGIINIALHRDITKTIRPGRYIDAVRVIIGTIGSTMWVGNILVQADPFWATA